MEFSTVRSGLTESVYHADVLALDRGGRELFRSGDPDRLLFYRSAIKPFQAHAATRTGISLPDEHLALAAASHSGHPAHLAIVSAILSTGGLDSSVLQCPPAWPLAASAREFQISRGVTGPRPIFHNCSGKHALMLRACVAAGWPTATYLERDHPLQQRIAALIGEVTGIEPGPVGIDGCGAPTFRGSVRGLARAFSALTADATFTAVSRAVSRFPALVAGNLRGDGHLGAWWGGPVKVGAEGLVGLSRHGVGLAVKAHGGRQTVAVAAAIETARRLGLLSTAMELGLDDVAEPPLFGGGARVGSLRVTEPNSIEPVPR